jgi:alpha-amylase
MTKKPAMEKPKNLNLLKTVPFENSFHFFTEHGKYTGITANSTVEFAEKLQIIPIQSVTFHFQRQDFQKWLKNTIGDEELAQRIDQIKAGAQDENLRKELFKAVHNRITELTKSSQISS